MYFYILAFQKMELLKAQFFHKIAHGHHAVDVQTLITEDAIVKVVGSRILVIVTHECSTYRLIFMRVT